MRPQCDDMAFLAQDDAADRDPVRLAHRLEHQAVGLAGTGRRHQVVRLVVEDRVDLRGLDELLDFDRLGLLGVERLEFGRLDHDVLIGGDLVALDDVLVGHLLAVGRADPPLLDARVIGVVELVKVHRLARDGAVELDRHVHQSERDRAAPDRTGHRRAPCRLPSARNPREAQSTRGIGRRCPANARLQTPGTGRSDRIGCRKTDGKDSR